MKNLKNITIHKNATIVEALNKLNQIKTLSRLILFVRDEEQRVLGTITDGDIRRSIIKSQNLQITIEEICNRNFIFEFYKDDFIDLSQYRKKDIKILPLLDIDKKLVDIIDLDRVKSRLPLDAILMAGGKGERLRPLTETTPKPLLKVGDKAIIDYNIESLLSYGIKNVSVTVNYLKEQIEKHFEKERDGVKINCIREPEFFGTMGAVKLVDCIHNDTCLIMNSDLFTNIDYEDFYIHFKEHDADMSVAVIPYSITVPYGIFDMEGRNITGIKEKPTYNYYANAGIYLIKKEVIELIPDNIFYNATDLMEQLIKVQKKVIRFPLTGYWIDIGKHEDYKKAQDLVKHL